MSSNRFEVITQYVSVERAIDALTGLIPRIGRHSTATRGGESLIHQSNARVLSGRERDNATIENPSRLHRRLRGLILEMASKLCSMRSFSVNGSDLGIQYSSLALRAAMHCCPESLHDKPQEWG
jgi:hypothetical protein